MQEFFTVVIQFSLPLAIGGAVGGASSRLWLQALTRHSHTGMLRCLAELLFVMCIAGAAFGLFGIMTNRYAAQSAPALSTVPEIPGGSGWILVGASDSRRSTFQEGPYAVPIRRDRLSQYDIKVGDKMIVVQPRAVICVDYRKLGADCKYLSPIKRDQIGLADDMGITLPIGTRLIVREVIEGTSRETGNIVLWLRVAIDLEAASPILTRTVSRGPH